MRAKNNKNNSAYIMRPRSLSDIRLTLILQRCISPQYLVLITNCVIIDVLIRFAPILRNHDWPAHVHRSTSASRRCLSVNSYLPHYFWPSDKSIHPSQPKRMLRTSLLELLYFFCTDWQYHQTYRQLMMDRQVSFTSTLHTYASQMTFYTLDTLLKLLRFHSTEALAELNKEPPWRVKVQREWGLESSLI